MPRAEYATVIMNLNLFSSTCLAKIDALLTANDCIIFGYKKHTTAL